MHGFLKLLLTVWGAAVNKISLVSRVRLCNSSSASALRAHHPKSSLLLSPSIRPPLPLSTSPLPAVCGSELLSVCPVSEGCICLPRGIHTQSLKGRNQARLRPLLPAGHPAAARETFCLLKTIRVGITLLYLKPFKHEKIDINLVSGKECKMPA